MCGAHHKNVDCKAGMGSKSVERFEPAQPWHVYTTTMSHDMHFGTSARLSRASCCCVTTSCRTAVWQLQEGCQSGQAISCGNGTTFCECIAHRELAWVERLAIRSCLQCWIGSLSSALIASPFMHAQSGVIGKRPHMRSSPWLNCKQCLACCTFGRCTMRFGTLPKQGVWHSQICRILLRVTSGCKCYQNSCHLDLAHACTAWHHSVGLVFLLTRHVDKVGRLLVGLHARKAQLLRHLRLLLVKLWLPREARHPHSHAHPRRPLRPPWLPRLQHLTHSLTTAVGSAHASTRHPGQSPCRH